MDKPIILLFIEQKSSLGRMVLESLRESELHNPNYSNYIKVMIAEEHTLLINKLGLGATRDGHYVKLPAIVIVGKNKTEYIHINNSITDKLFLKIVSK